MSFENKFKTVRFWLRLGVVNHCVALAVVAFGCAYSGFSCKGDSMKDVLSLYAFTLFTPQLALEVILLLALFLAVSSMRELRENSRLVTTFLATLALLVIFAYWR